jgi:formate-dependent nitrite reductase complex subunit NrfG
MMVFRHFRLFFNGLICLIATCLYLTSGRPSDLLAQQEKNQRWGALTQQQLADSRWVQLQQQLQQAPQNSVLWAQLGEYYLDENNFDAAIQSYQQALALQGRNAELYSALAAVFYYQAKQRMTPQAIHYIEKALEIDKEEVSALMLLAEDAFLQADYVKAISLWQRLLESHSSRINRQQLVEAINMANILLKKQ